MKYSRMIELSQKLQLAIHLLQEDCIHREECGINAKKIKRIVDELKPIHQDFMLESQYIIDRFVEANNFKD